MPYLKLEDHHPRKFWKVPHDLPWFYRVPAIPLGWQLVSINQGPTRLKVLIRFAQRQESRRHYEVIELAWLSGLWSTNIIRKFLHPSLRFPGAVHT